MPLPLILWGAAALLAGTGVVKGVGAINNFDKAKTIGESAHNRYKKAEDELIVSRDQTNSEFSSLGKLKLSIFKNQINHLVTAIRNSTGSRSKLKDYHVIITPDQLKEMERMVLKSMEIEKGLGAGAVTGALAAWGAYGSVGMLASASTGTAIAGLSGAAATNATLAWLGGGALSAGGFGIAGGTIALGGIVLGPALAVGGFMLASKAEEALTQANKYQAEVDIAISEMENIKIVLATLRANAKELSGALSQMAKRFDAIKVNDDRDTNAFDQMMIVGKGIKNLLDIAIMNKDGDATKNIKAKISGYLEI